MVEALHFKTAVLIRKLEICRPMCVSTCMYICDMQYGNFSYYGTQNHLYVLYIMICTQSLILLFKHVKL